MWAFEGLGLGSSEDRRRAQRHHPTTIAYGTQDEVTRPAKGLAMPMTSEQAVEANADATTQSRSSLHQPYLRMLRAVASMYH